MLDYLKESDLRVLGLLLSPDYVIPAAREYGMGDVILGGPLAFKEVRGLVREYCRFIRFREKKSVRDLDLAQSLRAIGWVGKIQPITPIPATSFRKVALAAWSSSVAADIPGGIWVKTGKHTKQELDRAVLLSLSLIFKAHPELNRAFLDGRVWQRHTPEIMLNLEIGEGAVRRIIFDSSGWSDHDMKIFLFRSIKRLFKIEKHPLRQISDELLSGWAESGFISSPAAAMVSLARTPMGWAQFFPANGVPIVVQVNDVNRTIMEKAFIGVRIDHRVFDGSHAERFYEQLELQVERHLGTM